jgi:hypothetical protein
MANASPNTKVKKKFELPKKLIADADTYRIDESSLEPIEVDTTKNLATGILYRHAGGLGLTSDTRLVEGPTMTAPAELTIIVFETDIPPQHHWTPQSGKSYRELYSTTLRAP